MAGIVNIFKFLIVSLLLIVSLVGIPVVLLYWILVFFGAQGRIDKALTKLDGTLMKDESLIHQGIQLRPFAFFSRRKIIGITNSRVITISRGIFGGFNMEDFQWKDLQDVTIAENVLSVYCGSNLNFKAFNMFIEIQGVQNDAATKIYQRGQFEEQAWEEKRRVRALEEKRAAAGGVVLHSATGGSAHGQEPTSNISVVEEIEKAKKLLDVGAISDAEFQEIKSKILSKSF